LVGSGLALSAIGGRLIAQSGPAGTWSARLAAAGFKGAILLPGSTDYQAARRAFVSNPRVPSAARMIAVCADESDVRRALDFVVRGALDFSVRAGGHDLLGASMCDGVVIDLSQLQSIAVDPQTRTVRVGAGVRSGKLNAALAERGLAVALGCAGQVGVAGLTLGGGLGWLAGRYGAACDHLLAARIVTADGRPLDVDADRHPDLLWALRGGGGNFGIVTELTLRAHPIPTVTSGVVALRGNDIASFLRRHRDYLASAGDDVDLEAYGFPAPTDPMIFVKACYSGDPARAERVLAPLRTLAPFVADDLAPRPYTGLIDPSGPVAPLFRFAAQARQPDDVPGLSVAAVSMAPVGDEAAAIIAEQAGRGQGNWVAGFAHLIHGAAARPPPGHSAMPRIPGLLTTYFLTSWRRSGEAGPCQAWLDESAARLRPHAKPTYLNYLTDREPAAVRAAYGSNYDRLRRIKRRYDPGNVFNKGRNIPPA
jgi:FAD/FMN-containing dehydrogenase